MAGDRRGVLSLIFDAVTDLWTTSTGVQLYVIHSYTRATCIEKISNIMNNSVSIELKRKEISSDSRPHLELIVDDSLRMPERTAMGWTWHKPFDTLQINTNAVRR